MHEDMVSAMQPVEADVESLPDFPTELILTRGLPGCGKTTWARLILEVERSKGRRIVRVNRDDLRRMALPSGYGKPDFATEKEISAIRDAALEHWLSAGVSVIVDDTNLRMRFARDLADLAERLGVELVVVDFFEVDLDTCLARNEDRHGTESYVPPWVIKDMYGRYLAGSKPGPVLPRPTAWQSAVVPYEPVYGAPEIALVDLDGTVALLNGRGAYDESCVSEDLPNHPVIEAVQAMAGLGRWERMSQHDRTIGLVFMSGRTEACRVSTTDWLSTHLGIAPEDVVLHMRDIGDQRPDREVKLELFNKHIRHRFEVRCVFDDRVSVVELWRQLGLVCFQVADGKF
jgi:predicted kinase